MRALSEYSYPTLFVVAFGLIVGVGLLVTASTSTASFGAFNTAWDGTADFRGLADTTGTESQLVQNTSEYTTRPAGETLAVILAPDQPYQRQETQHIRQFVRQGGTLVVADERATPTNELLAAVGADARIDGTPLRDGRYHYQSPAAPQIRNLSDHPLTANVSTLTLNHGSAVTPNTATTVATTSGYAYRDINQNQQLDQAESVSQYPVITTEQVGDGQVVVIGDASLFINTMLEQGGNRQFARNLLATHQQVLFDYSHTAALPPIMKMVLFLRQTPISQFLIGGLGILVFTFLRTHSRLLAVVNQRLRNRHPSLASPHSTRINDADRGTTDTSSPVADTALVTHLRTHYPDWDDERLHRIVAARRQPPTDASASTVPPEADDSNANSALDTNT
ncbi:DUF4350 domain-containing protein [Halorussus salinus]|uniref:DUF4350 domain-containing protein n=1 Tax=Halorussus salinus TaxID=1364935 RepID=UPI00138F5018|nr:DUF4350 domain-containing protein [Halorussus salinus]